MSVTKLQDLQTYQLSRDLIKLSYPILSKLNDRDYRSQMIKSSLSITSNIAEGYGRFSRPEFAKFLTYSNGSALEFRTQLEACVDIGLIQIEVAAPVIEMCDRICAMNYKLIQSLRR
jgi:four helix bundle protein